MKKLMTALLAVLLLSAGRIQAEDMIVPVDPFPPIKLLKITRLSGELIWNSQKHWQLRSMCR